jgi:hypothetical protein
VQTAWELLSLGGGSVPFSGRAELTELLASTPAVTECAVRQHLRFALRRGLDDSDECAVDELTEQVAAADGDLRVLLRSVVGGEHFERVRPR